MSKTHQMYVCGDCGYARYHPITYCPKCPGKLTKRDIPHPACKTIAERQELLSQQGIDYSWEECPISPIMILVERLNKLREFEAYCFRMSVRKIDCERTPEGTIWHERQKPVREAIKSIQFTIAKVNIAEEIMDASWEAYKPFRKLIKAQERQIRDKIKSEVDKPT